MDSCSFPVSRVKMSSTRKLLICYLLLKFITNSHIFKQDIKSGTRKSISDSSEYSDEGNESRFNLICLLGNEDMPT